MKRYDLLTPEGTRDLLFDECIAKRFVQDNLTRLFSSFGYSEVMTPGVEFYDVFNGKVRYFPQETMYKLVDGKNRLMVLRPDNTMPIARLAATRLKEEPLPLKLFYNQSIFMVNPKNSGRDDEFTQSGIEILGGESRAADYEALILAAKSLFACSNSEDVSVRLEIGESSIFRMLIEELNVSEEEADSIQSLIDSKNYPALNEALSKFNSTAAEALKNLPKLFGGAEVFDKAEQYMITDGLKQKLASLREVYDGLISFGIDIVKVDLGLVHKKNYYTGLIFRGYMAGYGQPVLSGGRYDALAGDFGRDVPAVGFAVNVEAAAKILLKNLKSIDARLSCPPDVLVFAEKGAELCGLKHCSEIAAKGKNALNSLFATIEEAETYAKRRGISQIDIVAANGTVISREV
ncbi:MAG: ATP phosphoribosyltransferase regulatory subunit [Oscillospiraceae bacterium]